MTERKKIAKEYYEKYKSKTSNIAEVARIMYSENKELFKSPESARCHLKEIKGGYDTTGVTSERLTEDEKMILESYRDKRSALEEECKRAGIDSNEVSQYWYKSKHFSLFVKPKGPTLEDLKKEIVEGMNEHSPKIHVFKRKKIKDAHCLVIDPADIHIGKYASEYETGEKYDMDIAVRRVHEGIEKLLSFASHYPLDQIILIIGNDILHTDTPRRTTTSGTPQDTHGQWYENFMVAQKLYIDIIDRLLPIANVHVMHNVSNHDGMTGWMLSQVVKAWYRKTKQVTFDGDMKHRKAYRYYNNFIGSTHGDGAKDADLPLLMAHEFASMWASTIHRYIYTHHVHHKMAKDRIGITIESSRSASGTDSWHHRNGYTGAPKAIEAYLHHKTNGQVARFSHVFK